MFKSYDVRGTYADQLDERFAYLLGRALPEVLPAGRVAVGYDARLSSPALCAALTAGLHEAGAHVVGLGLCVTELVYYALGSDQGFDHGVMITASHNPPQYNGFKVVRAGGELVLGRNGLDAVCERMQDGAAGTFPGGAAPAETVALLGDYVDFALDLVGMPGARRLRVVVDAGNGVGGLLWEALSPRVGLEPLRINCEPDGRFPVHHPDPSRRENLEPLVQRVLAVGADLGLCYDGD
ncbi:MAG: phosphohexomutase domain-containing protein, partial [Planctomycetota bacterium]